MQRFSVFHPLSSFLYLVSAVCVTMFSRNIVIALISLLSAVLFALSLKVLKNVLFYSLIFILTALTNPIFSHNGVTELFFLNGNPVTLEALVYGIYLGAVITSVLIWFMCYNTVITSDKFLCLFGALIPKAALIISMALRLIPQFIRNGSEIVGIQNSINPIKGGLIKKTKRYTAVFSALIGRSLESAVEQSDSMKARGYGKRKRVSYSRFRFRISDLILLCFTLCSTIYIVLVSGTMSYNYYPELDTVLFDYSYALCAIYFLTPTIVNLWGEIKWKYSTSKI